MKPVIANLDACRLHNHTFQMIGSDKRPLKRNLLCVTCTLEVHQNVYVAFGDEYGSFGLWPDRRKPLTTDNE